MKAGVTEGLKSKNNLKKIPVLIKDPIHDGDFYFLNSFPAFLQISECFNLALYSLKLLCGI